MIDAMGLSIYDAASEADETGVWVFLGNAINQGSIYGDWQQNPSVEHNMPDEVALGVPSKSEQISTGMKWLLGGLTMAGLFALGASAAGGGGDDGHENTPSEPSPNTYIPKPRALVQQFSVAENPTNPEERAAVVQAEVPAEANTQPENHALLLEPIIRELDEAQTNLNNLPNTETNTDTAYYVASDNLFFPNDWLNTHNAEMAPVV